MFHSPIAPRKPQRSPGALSPARPLWRRRSQGATTTELLLVIALIALGAVAIIKKLGVESADVARQVADAVARLEGIRPGEPAAPGATHRPALPEPPRERTPASEAPKESGGFTGFLKTAGAFAIEMSPIGDIKTLMDPDASFLDKALAVGGLATTFIPGAGQVAKAGIVAVKAGKAANKTADAVDAARDAKRLGDEAKDGVDGIGGGKKRGGEDDRGAKDEPQARDDADAEECVGGACKNGTCFAAGTPVHTADGLVPIEDVQPGELLWSRDDQTGAVALQRVLHRFVTPNRVLLGIRLDDGSGALEALRVTPPHPFWTGRGWVAASELAVDDEVLLISGAWATVAAAETLEEGGTVYNFEVEDYHTYFVGNAGAWVHNQSQRPCPVSTRSRIGESPYAKRLADSLKRNPQAQKDVDHLLDELRAGNANAGIGTRALGNGYLELRGRNGGRVIVKATGNDSYDIVGKFQGHAMGDAENGRIINRLMREHEDLG